MTATLTVLGYRAGRPDAGSACSGYLVTDGSMRLLVDCGPGVITELLSRGLEHRLDAIVLTHLHQDHCLDVLPLAFTRLLTSAPVPRIPLWVPEDAMPDLETLDQWAEVPTDPAVGRPLSTAFDIKPLPRDGNTTQTIAGVSLTGYRAKHAVPSAALRFGLSSGTLTFSSDTGWCSGVVDAARDADVFVCEATYLDADPAMLADHGHLTAGSTGALAAEAGVGHLIVSHLIGENDDACYATARSAASQVEGCTLARVGLDVPVLSDK